MDNVGFWLSLSLSILFFMSIFCPTIPAFSFLLSALIFLLVVTHARACLLSLFHYALSYHTRYFPRPQTTTYIAWPCALPYSHCCPHFIVSDHASSKCARLRTRFYWLWCIIRYLFAAYQELFPLQCLQLVLPSRVAQPTAAVFPLYSYYILYFLVRNHLDRLAAAAVVTSACPQPITLF